jgi:ribonuclease HI/8-oxo-dGTP pyrophosphatase MutT (NUDIX family)
VSKIEKQTIFVNALVHNAEQAVLVLRRSMSDNYMPGYLELPGGRLQPGESLEHALNRKLQQEVGISSELPLYFTSVSQDDKNGAYLRVVFEVKYDQKTPIELSGSHDEYIWVARSQLAEYKFAGNTKAILENYLGETIKSEELDDEKTTLTIYSDGGSRGNPGPSASAYVIYKNKAQLESGGRYIGITSNNQAEYRAVALALEAAKKYAESNTEVNIYMDSLLVVNQMNGIYKIKNRDIWPIHAEIQELMKQFKKVIFSHVPRENNKVADAKVNEILDEHSV